MAEQGPVALLPMPCAPSLANPPVAQTPPDKSELVCPGGLGRPDVLILTDPDISWPVLRTEEGLRSFQDDLLGAMQPFGAGLLYFDPLQDTVWAATDGAGLKGYVISLTGNDPVTLDRRRAFISVPVATFDAAALHPSLGTALDRVLAP